MTQLELGDTVAVISPHLDDAVFSCGSLMTHMSFTEIEVRVVTVFAGDPDCQFRVGQWDERAGFETAGGATRARRAEDEAAVKICGATPIHLPFHDDQYRLTRDIDDIVSKLADAIKGCDSILIPGWPLTNPDHWWAARAGLLAAEEVALDHGVVLYAEEPYRTWMGPKPPRRSPLVTHDWWVAYVDEDGGTSGRKRQAMSQYGSQLALLAEAVSEEELGGSALIMSITNAASDPGEFYASVTGSQS